MRKLILGHLVYLYTPLGVLACALGILKGGNWVWLGVAIFAASIIIDTITAPLHLRGAAASKDGAPEGNATVLNLMMYSTLFVFVALQLALAWRVYQYAAGVPIETMTWNGWEFTNGISTWGLVGANFWRRHASGSRHHLRARAFPHQGHWVRDFPHDDGLVGHRTFLLRACLQPPSGAWSGMAWAREQRDG